MIEKYMEQWIDILYRQVTQNESDEYNQIPLSTQIIKEKLYATLVFCLNEGILDDHYFQSLFKQNCLDYFKQNYNQKMITLKLQIRHLENIYRIVEIPYTISLDELSYYVLASLHACENHDFYVTLDKKTYYESDDALFNHEQVYASDYQLEELAIQKGTHLEICYDFKEKYVIDVEVLDIQDHHGFNKARILQSEGYGIWEDAHWLLELYYEHKEAFMTCIHDMGYDEDDFCIEDYDQEKFIQNYQHIYKNYKYEKTPLLA